MSKSVKFTASGSCNAFGNFAPGDIARNIPDDLAEHLVKEAMCAKYLIEIQNPDSAPAQAEQAPAEQAPVEQAAAAAKRPRKAPADAAETVDTSASKDA